MTSSTKQSDGLIERTLYFDVLVRVILQDLTVCLCVLFRNSVSTLSAVTGWPGCKPSTATSRKLLGTTRCPPQDPPGERHWLLATCPAYIIVGVLPFRPLLACYTHGHCELVALFLIPKGGQGCLMSPPCLASQGCCLIPLYYRLSCFSA